MNKVNSILVSVILCLTTGVHARIWFVGDKMPGTNRTITEEPPLSMTWMPHVNMDEDQYEHVFGRGITRMTLAMEKVMGNEINNLVFAPISIAAAMSVILLGSAGKTAAEIASLLGILAGVDFTDRTQIIHNYLGRYFTKFETGSGIELGSQLKIANGIFIQNDFQVKTEFIENAKNIYKCEVLPLDFKAHTEEARGTINGWVENRTEGRIKELLQLPLLPATTVIVANAFFFNGQWEHPFHGRSRMGPFYVTKNEPIEMLFMINNAEIPYAHTKDYRIFGMPYKGGDLTMYIILPQKNLHKFVGELKVDSLESMINRTKIQMVVFSVPRMKMESNLNLRKPLEDLGLRSLFDATASDLSGIAAGVYTDTVQHKVEIQVTETGTIASAGTATALVRSGMPIVRVDRPFLFFIYHNPTNTIIFWGSVFKPTPFFDK